MFIKDSTLFIITMPCRKESVLKELKKNGITKFSLVEAVDGLSLGAEKLNQMLMEEVGSEWFVPYGGCINDKNIGAVGCYLSHIKALKMAVSWGWDSVILEDDINFNFTDYVELATEADIVYLGGVLRKNKKDSVYETLNGSNYIDSTKVKYYTTMGYWVREPQLILDLMKKYRPKRLDCFYCSYCQKQLNCHFINPPMITQNPALMSLIDIDGRYKQRFLNAQIKGTSNSVERTIPDATVSHPFFFG